MHKELDLTSRRNVYVVGDLHGDWDILYFALRQLKFNYRDFIVSVGDLIDRGEKNLECVSFFTLTENATAVRGNHEDMMICGLLDNNPAQYDGWLVNGGTWAVHYPRLMLDGIARSLQQFPHAITIRRGNTKVGICHAECPTPNWEDYTLAAGGMYKWDNLAIWGRNRIKQKSGTPILGVDYTIHGHSVRDTPVTKCNQHWIDTGSVFDEGSGKYALTIAEIVEGEDKPIFHRFVKDCFEIGGYRMC